MSVRSRASMTDDLDRRLQLAEDILALEYPGYAGAWLKAMPTADVLDAPLRATLAGVGESAERLVAARREVVQRFLEDHLNLLTPEHIPYTELLTADWRPIGREEMERHLDAVLAMVAEDLRERAEEDASERADAEAAGYLETLGPPWAEGVMIDLAALRRWFSGELWGADAPTWWTNIRATARNDAPAVIGVDAAMIAILWSPLCM
jgi:hypothetical protein